MTPSRPTSGEAALRDLVDAIELMDTKVTPYGEREDGTIANYIVQDSTWHRVLAIARGHKSDKAQVALDKFRALIGDPDQTPEKVKAILDEMAAATPTPTPGLDAPLTGRELVEALRRSGFTDVAYDLACTLDTAEGEAT